MASYPRDEEADTFDTFLKAVGRRPFDVNQMNIVDEPATRGTQRTAEPQATAGGAAGSVAASYLRRAAARQPFSKPTEADAEDARVTNSEAVTCRAHVAQFSMTPRQVKAHLDKHVIAQESAKRALAVAVCDHYNFVRRCLASPEVAEQHHLKPNVLLLGPSGSGKTHLLRALTKLLEVPFVKADATKFSATGYVGGDVDDIVRGLLPAAGGDLELAEYGIIYVDEVDKLAQRSARALGVSTGGTINTKSVQSALLKLMEDAEVPIQVSASSLYSNHLVLVHALGKRHTCSNGSRGASLVAPYQHAAPCATSLSPPLIFDRVALSV